MKTKVKVIADSISEHGKRITTILLTHPHLYSDELRKHRELSVTTRRISNLGLAIRQVNKNPYIPDYFDDSTENLQYAKLNWLMLAGTFSIATNRMEQQINNYDLIINLLKPYLYVETVITATSFDNFILKRRNDTNEMSYISRIIEMELERYKPTLNNLWHLPFNDESWHGVSHQQRQLACAMQCYQYSLIPEHEEAQVIINANKLSAFEHVARVNKYDNVPSLSSFDGWIQLRKTFTNDRL